MYDYIRYIELFISHDIFINNNLLHNNSEKRINFKNIFCFLFFNFF